MGAQTLSSRAVIGMFYEVLASPPPAWVDAVAMTMPSDQPVEQIRWLGQVPDLRKWIGGRQAKGLSEYGIDVTMEKWESTLKVQVDDLQLDKTGQLRVRISELVRRAAAHRGKLLSLLMIAGEAATCYDGQYFYDTDHSEGSSGTQSNSISYAAATGTTPTVEEMQGAILDAVAAILSFKDNEGEPINDGAREFLVQVPITYMRQAVAALSATVINNSSNMIQALGVMDGMRFGLNTNPRLTWTTKFAVHRTDAVTKPFIVLEQLPLQIQAIAEGSELETLEDMHLYGLKAKHTVAFGMWQQSCLVTFT